MHTWVLTAWMAARSTPKLAANLRRPISCVRARLTTSTSCVKRVCSMG